MGLVDPSPKTVEQIGETAKSVGNELLDHGGKDAPGLFRQLLEVLAEYEFVFGLRKRQ